MEAAAKGYLGVMMLLLDNGASVFRVDNVSLYRLCLQSKGYNIFTIFLLSSTMWNRLGPRH